MPYCNQCGTEIKAGEQFCGTCGARQGQAAVATSSATPPPTNAEYINQYPPQKSGGTGAWKMIVMAVLAIGLIAVGVLYGIENSNLNKAKENIATLENNVSTLQTQLTAEQAHAASLQSELTIKINDLNASRAEVQMLESELTESELRVANLQSELNTANTELAQAYTEIAGLTSANTALSQQISVLKDPRHFNSMQELQTWLADDDTNTNAAYSSLSAQAKAYVLQVKALRDGFILSACIDWDSNFIYSWNVAIVGDTVYSVNAASDVINVGPSFSDALPLHPLPLS
jgi:septal ring factor EnvC (AmiA/AmiB activator)